MEVLKQGVSEIFYVGGRKNGKTKRLSEVCSEAQKYVQAWAILKSQIQVATSIAKEMNKPFHYELKDFELLDLLNDIEKKVGI